MKNLIFSKKYLKTKLGILTLIVTVAYHYLSKDKSLYDGMKQGMDSELKNDSIKNEELGGFAFEDEYITENIVDESPYDDNAAIISSEWILEYWDSIRNRTPAINVPKLSQGIIADSEIRKLDISDFLDSQILSDIYKLIKNNKYVDKNGLKPGTIAWDIGMYLNIPVEMLKVGVDAVLDYKNKLVEKRNEVTRNMVGGFKNGVSNLYNGVLGYKNKMVAKSKEVTYNAWGGFKNGVSNLYNGVLGYKNKTVAKSKEVTYNMWGGFKNGVSYLYNGSMRVFTSSTDIETNADQIEENVTQHNPAQNNIVQQDRANNATFNSFQNNVVQQDRNNNTTLNPIQNNIVKEDRANNTTLNPTQNNVEKQDRDNNTTLNLTQNNIVQQYRNNNTTLNPIQNNIIQEDRTSNTMLNDNFNNENTYDRVIGKYLFKIKMFYNESYDNMKNKIHQMSAFFSSNFLRNTNNTSAESTDSSINA